MIVGVVVVHILLVRKHGIVPPFALKESAAENGSGEPALSLPSAAVNGGGEAAPSRSSAGDVPS